MVYISLQMSLFEFYELYNSFVPGKTLAINICTCIFFELFEHIWNVR